jgi:DNA repair ATPase RecN
MTDYFLQNVKIENFKSIKAACVDFQEGFMIITGPNGAGKSCLLESIAFALGQRVQFMRVSTLKGIRNADDVGLHRTS